MVNYSSIYPLSGGGGNAADNTLLLLRPVNGKIIDLVTGSEPTQMFHGATTQAGNGKITIDSSTSKFGTASIKIESAGLNTLSTHFYDSDWTIELWQRPLFGLYGSFNSLFARGDTQGSSVTSSIYLGYSASNYGLGCGNGNTYFDAFLGSAPTFINTATFNHFAAVKSVNTIKAYVNGILRLTSLPITGSLWDMNASQAYNMSNGLLFGSGWFAVDGKAIVRPSDLRHGLLVCDWFKFKRYVRRHRRATA
jgi:hypothetical protein